MFSHRAVAIGALAAILVLAAGDGCSSDKASCSVFDGSNYDQSCTTDCDCVVVRDPRSCCGGPAINLTAKSQYMSAVNNEGTACLAGPGCTVSCGIALPCCISGRCEISANDMCAVTAADASADPSVTDAGFEAASTDTGRDATGNVSEDAIAPNAHDAPVATDDAVASTDRCTAFGGVCLTTEVGCAAVDYSLCGPQNPNGPYLYCCRYGPSSDASADASAE
jgi:hypothetical protein